MKLSERAINCKHWRWMPGMGVFDNSEYAFMSGKRARRVIDDDGTVSSKLQCACDGVHLKTEAMNPDYVPDLSDPATMGCLLALVRDAYKDAYASASSLHDENGYWCVRDCDGFIIATGRSEREALVIALEKADAE